MIPWCLISFWGTIFIYSRDENGLCSWCEAIFIVIWSNFYQERKPSNFVENSLRSCLLCFFSGSPYFYNLFASFIFPFSFLSTCTSLFVIRLFSLIAYISYLIILCASSYSSSSFCLLFLLLYIMCTFGFWFLLFQILGIVLFVVFLRSSVK